MKISRTEQGFELIEFKDSNGNSCSLQASSLAEYEPPGTSAIWLGVGPHRMHLRLKDVRQLASHLQAWVDNGSFER